jgi:hypothetical protein
LIIFYVILFACILVEGSLYDILGKEMLFEPNEIRVLLEHALTLSGSKSDSINALVFSFISSYIEVVQCS